MIALQICEIRPFFFSLACLLWYNPVFLEILRECFLNLLVFRLQSLQPQYVLLFVLLSFYGIVDQAREFFSSHQVIPLGLKSLV